MLLLLQLCEGREYRLVFEGGEGATYSFVTRTRRGIAYVGTPCERRKVHRFFIAAASVSGVRRSRVIPAAPAWPS